MFRLVGEIRQRGADPKVWRPMLVKRLRRVMRAQVVVSSEVPFRRDRKTGDNRLHDIGWGCDEANKVWEVRTETENAQPDSYWLTATGPTGADVPLTGNVVVEVTGQSGAEEVIPGKPARPSRGGEHFILSQISLPHVGAVDQLCLHRAFDDVAFTGADYRLVRLVHRELGRLWKREALRQAKNKKSELPPRLRQTLDELLSGSSEKQIALKLQLSPHTIHNYVKALHQRFDATSRGELLAKAGGKAKNEFTPKLSF